MPGVNGSDGNDGGEGTDGIGLEWIFATTASSTLPTSQYPANTWGYDTPSTAGGLRWYDGVRSNSINATTPYLWRAARRVMGQPIIGAAVAAAWGTPTLEARWAADGVDGADGTDGTVGEDGRSFEYVFTSYSSASIPSSRRPSNAWGYDTPSTAGGQTWYDDAPALTAARPHLHRAQREVFGTPARGAQIADLWSIPRVVGRFGEDGQDGDPGRDGTDGRDGVDGMDGGTNIPDGSIDTRELAPNAVSLGNYRGPFNTVSVGTNWTTIVTVPLITGVGDVVTVAAHCEVTDNRVTDWRIVVTRSGRITVLLQDEGGDDLGGRYNHATYMHGPTATGQSYSLQAKRRGNNNPTIGTNSYIQAFKLKR